ncbi:unnamed protein product, partial [marine sediment metagenome]
HLSWFRLRTFCQRNDVYLLSFDDSFFVFAKFVYFSRRNFRAARILSDSEQGIYIYGHSLKVPHVIYTGHGDGDDDNDDDNDGDDDDDDEVAGGANTPPSDTEELETDITGKSLSNPNPFFKRMKSRDPNLFLTDSEGKFKAYSRICPSSSRRQPVILTDEEKERIDKDHPGSYDEAVKYGSDPSKKYWYICPRYWSLKDDTSLTEAEVKSGKYGKVIPTDAKTVPEGAPIFEFTDNRQHRDAEGNYAQLYPGFLKQGSHPNGKCLPCCFKCGTVQ